MLQSAVAAAAFELLRVFREQKNILVVVVFAMRTEWLKEFDAREPPISQHDRFLNDIVAVHNRKIERFSGGGGGGGCVRVRRCASLSKSAGEERRRRAFASAAAHRALKAKHLQTADYWLLRRRRRPSSHLASNAMPRNHQTAETRKFRLRKSTADFEIGANDARLRRKVALLQSKGFVAQIDLRQKKEFASLRV